MFFSPDTTVRSMTTLALYRINGGFFRICLLCTLFFTCAAFSTASAADEGTVKPPATSAAASSLSMTDLPVEWFLDTTGNLGVEQLRQPMQRNAFAPFGEDFFIEGARSAGILWFRIALAPLGDALPRGNVVIDLSQRVRHSLPHGATVWLDSVGNKPITRLIADAHGFFPLPASASISNVVYIRVDGQPSLGFVPVARSANILSFFDTYGDWFVRCVLMCALALSLLRGIVEQREWRMWSALFAGTLLVTEFWGAPATTLGKVFPPDLPGLLAPGVALLIFPHIGRQLMRTRDNAPWIDIFFILIGPLGLAITLVPLLPGQVWTVRYLQLWPLLMLLPLPATFFAVIRGIPGALRFAFCCLLPPLGLVALLPMPEIRFAAVPAQVAWASFMALLPALCATSSATLLACLPTPKHSMPERRHDPLPLENPALNLSGLSVATAMSGSQGAKHNEATSAVHLLARLEQRLRGPMDDLHIELHALSHMALPSSAKEHVQRLLRAGNDVTQLMYDEASGIHGLTSPATMDDELSEPALRKESFDLHSLIRSTHNAIAGDAEHKNLALTWYTAPQLASQYVGDPVRLSRVLTLLAESAVGATTQGLVQIRVQRLPESNDPGHLLFTVSDTGKGIPPVDRSTMAIVRAWELSAAYGGTVSIDSGPSGTIVSFTLRLRALGRAKSTEFPGKAPAPSLSTTISDALRIFVVSDVPSNRELLTYFLDELPHEVREARSADEVLAMYTQTPGALLLFDGDLPEHEVVAGIAEIRAFEGEQGLPLTSILAVVNDEEQGERLRRAGCKHTLLKPVTRTELRRMALRLAPVPKPRKAVLHTATPKLEKPEKPFVVFTAPPPVDAVPLETPLVMEQPPATKESGLPPLHVATQHSAAHDCDASPVAEPKQPETSKTSSRAVTIGAAKSQAAKEELIFLQPPTLRVRSNVGDPKPLIRTEETQEDVERNARKHRAETLRQSLEEKRLKKEELASGTEPTKLHKLASQAIARSQTPTQPAHKNPSSNTAPAETPASLAEQTRKKPDTPTLQGAAIPQTDELPPTHTHVSAPPLHNAPDTEPDTEPNTTPAPVVAAPSEPEHSTLQHSIDPAVVEETAPLRETPLAERAVPQPVVSKPSNLADATMADTKHRVHVGTVDDTAPKHTPIPDVLFPIAEPKKGFWGKLFGKSTKKSAEKTTQAPSLQPDFTPIRAAGEWVGDPQPIVRTPQSEPEGERALTNADSLLPLAPHSDTELTTSEAHTVSEKSATDTTEHAPAPDAQAARNDEAFLLNDEPFLLTDDMITQPADIQLLPTLDDTAAEQAPKTTRKEPQRSALLYLPGMEPDNDTLELNLDPPMEAYDSSSLATIAHTQASNAPLSFDPPDTESLIGTDTAATGLELHLDAPPALQTAETTQPMELSQAHDPVPQTTSASTNDAHGTQQSQLQQQESHADAVDQGDEGHVEALLRQLAEQSQEAQAAFNRNDMEAVSDMGTHMAYTAQALGMPSLVDLTLCLAEEALSGQAETAAPLLEDVCKAVANECSLGNEPGVNYL